MNKKKKKPTQKRGKWNGKGSKQTRGERVSESLAETNDKMDQHARMLAENDESWYAANPQLMKDYASYPFGTPVGLPFKTVPYTGRVPGVIVYKFLPTIGVADAETSAINVAMRKLYSFVRHANSGAKNYDAPDLMLYIIAVDSARMYLAKMKRLYGSIMNYTAYNRYYPESIIAAQGGDIADLEANINDFRGFINLYAAKLNQLWVPEGFSYLQRHQWMCEHIYVDSQQSPKAQTYLYDPMGFYQFSVSGNPAVGGLVNKWWPSTGKLADIIKAGNDLLNPLITNEDIGIMAGDILKAYGAEGCIKTFGITEEYRVFPEYVPEVLSQFENATIVAVKQGSTEVTQDTTIGGGYLKSQPIASVQIAGVDALPTTAGQQAVANAMVSMLHGKILNFHHTDVQPGEVMVATRLAPVLSKEATYSGPPGGNFINAFSNMRACGSEIVIQALMFTMKNGKANSRDILYTVNWTPVKTSSVDAIRNAVNPALNGSAKLSNFDWHFGANFMVMVYTADGEYSWTTPELPMQDLDFWTELDDANLANMHDVALLSEFTVPKVQ